MPLTGETVCLTSDKRKAIYTGAVSAPELERSRRMNALTSLCSARRSAHGYRQAGLNLNALGFGLGNQNDFLRLGRILEDVGLSAYAGSSGMLSSPSVITTAGRILAIEGENVSTIRTQIARLNISTTPVDGADMIPPPSGTMNHYLSINPANGLPAVRTPGQVLHLAYRGANISQGGFFPTGVNGAIIMSTEPAIAANLT
jgi:ferritin-like protein